MIHLAFHALASSTAAFPRRVWVCRVARHMGTRPQVKAGPAVAEVAEVAAVTRRTARLRRRYGGRVWLSARGGSSTLLRSGLCYALARQVLDKVFRAGAQILRYMYVADGSRMPP